MAEDSPSETAGSPRIPRARGSGGPSAGLDGICSLNRYVASACNPGTSTPNASGDDPRTAGRQPGVEHGWDVAQDQRFCPGAFCSGNLPKDETLGNDKLQTHKRRKRS